MKKLVITLLMLAVGINVFCQQIPAADLKIQNEQYLHKSKVQKTWAWIMIGTGAAIIIAGAASSGSGTDKTGGWFNFDDLNRSLRTGAYITGGIIMAGSIPLFIASANNREKAAGLNVFLKAEQTPAFSLAGYSIRTFPAAGIRIVLK